MLHGRESGSGQLIRIDHHVDSSVFEFFLRHRIEGSRHHHHGRRLILLPELLHKSKDLIRFLLPAVNHNSVCSRLHVRFCTHQRILHALFQNQAFDPGNDHELFRLLCAFSCCDLGAEIFNRILRLFHFRSEK